MIIDTTITKAEKRMGQEPLLSLVGLNYAAIWSKLIYVEEASPLTNEQREAIITHALKTDEGCKALADAMVEPIRCCGLEYDN